MSKIFDAHSHFMPQGVAEHTAFFKQHWSDSDRQLQTMDTLGIDKALLLYPTSDAHLNMGGWGKVCEVYNAQIAQVVQGHQDRFIGAGILPADAPQEFASEMNRCLDLGLKAITLGSSYNGVYLDDENFFPVYELAQKDNIPIHVHPQIINPIGEERVKDPLLTPVLEYVFDVSMTIGKMMMEEVFLKFPDVKFIFAHYGGVIPFVKERFDNTYQMLRRRNFVKDLEQLPSDYFKNLYFDVSGSRSAASLLCALEVVDAKHLVFGSDFPANQDIAGSIDVIRQSDLPEDHIESILSGNSRFIFG
ncbi:MAG: amidohydrolase [Candidatus Omnitrophica bacterium]|nr:amidohydrolase [Candidatus Omnitrophota bacterium]